MNLCAYKKDVTSTSVLSKGRIILFMKSGKKHSWLHCHGGGSAGSWCNKWSCFISFICQLSCCLHVSSSRPVSCSVVVCYRSFAHWACSLPLCQPGINTLAVVGFKQYQTKQLLVSWVSSGYKVMVALWLSVWHMHAPNLLRGYIFFTALYQYQYC